MDVFSQDHLHEDKTKQVGYLSIVSDLEMDTRLINSLFW